jgi:hypothetical protein
MGAGHPIRNNSLDWLKWFAITTMFIDHLRYIPKYDWDIFFAIGRTSYPIFALLCGWNLALYTRNKWLFTKRVLLFGAGLMAITPFTAIGPLPLNPLITLGLGLALAIALEKVPNTIYKLTILIIISIIAYIFHANFDLGHIISYGWSGVALVCTSFLLALNVNSKDKAYGSFLVLTLIYSFYLNEGWQYQLIAILTSGVAILLLCAVKMPKFPLINNYWLYLSFPISIIIPSIIKELTK